MVAKRMAFVAGILSLVCLFNFANSAGASATTTPEPYPSQNDFWPGGQDDEGWLDSDYARESLESRYENPADVALPPKLLIPRSSQGKVNTFDVFQLQHQFHSSKLGLRLEPRLTMARNQSASLASVPLNVDAVKISFKTPAQEFFDVASLGLLVLGSMAVAMGALILVRSKSKDQSNS